MPLRIAAKVDPADREYFETRIEPLLSQPGIEFLGEIADSEKQALLGEAFALLMPIDWPEPFGLVMIESMACGTPVIAFRNGSVEEVVDDGVTGFVVESIDEALQALESCRDLDRGVALQLNVLSLSGYYGSKEKEVAEKMLQEGLYTYVGTDLHHERHLKRLSYMQLDQKVVKRMEQTNWQNLSI